MKTKITGLKNREHIRKYQVKLQGRRCRDRKGLAPTRGKGTTRHGWRTK